MKIVQTRRISQLVFFVLFGWFCIVATVGESFWQIQGWPVNWLLQLDPLVAIGTVLTTHTLYRGLLWALATIILTILFGRFFCGWVCPFGTIHQVVGYLAHRKASLKQKLQLNSYHNLQRLKYYLLIVFLAAAAYPSHAAVLFTGLLDPIPLISRSFNLVLLPMLDASHGITSVKQRFFEGGGLILIVFFLSVLANMLIPRFYCRFICPLGALFGLMTKVSLWKISKKTLECSDCKACERDCEGGCEPSTRIRSSECLLCCNCLDACEDQIMTYQGVHSNIEQPGPDISRRGFALSLVSGLISVPALNLDNRNGANYYSSLIRPPGALAENEFLQRCIRCGQCMRICPTNVLQPVGFEYGIEALWTPALNNRIGSSGCQLNCIACGHICPTSAVRPLTFSEKIGSGDFKPGGPIKIGTAFLDRGRCLPWAMDKPCIVCEENCPVSPKAVFTREEFATIRDGILSVKEIHGERIIIQQKTLVAGHFSTGDYYCLMGETRYRILSNSTDTLMLDGNPKADAPAPSNLFVQIRLQKPHVDISRCTGCGICEHECPVSGKRAIRVSAEGETRNSDRTLLLKRWIK
ncbi:MAG: 4Fe-4S binding protein [Proteobacteria bacterium]|nr:4Fe-4S binding protein [Pseudomonadota bacterium]